MVAALPARKAQGRNTQYGCLKRTTWSSLDYSSPLIGSLLVVDTTPYLLPEAGNASSSSSCIPIAQSEPFRLLATVARFKEACRRESFVAVLWRWQSMLMMQNADDALEMLLNNA